MFLKTFIRFVQENYVLHLYQVLQLFFLVIIVKKWWKVMVFIINCCRPFEKHTLSSLYIVRYWFMFA